MQKAEQHYRWAREVFSQIGDVYRCAGANNNLGEIAYRQGRLDEALTYYEDGLQALQQIDGSLYLLGLFHNNIGATFIRRGNIDSAREHLQMAQKYFEQAQARDFLPEMHRLFAEVALQAGDLPEAEIRSQEALNLARELSMRGEEGSSLRELGLIAMAQNELDRAEQHLNQSIRLLEDVGDEYEWARSQLSLARLYISRTNKEAGLSALEKSTEVFQRLDARIDLAAAQALRKKLTSGGEIAAGGSLLMPFRLPGAPPANLPPDNLIPFPITCLNKQTG
ncbi:MAG: tetratricopeptide repeat protein [Anaerolineae bacterium]